MLSVCRVCLVSGLSAVHLFLCQVLSPVSVSRTLLLTLQVTDNEFLTNKFLFLKKIKSSNYFIWKSVLIILSIKRVFKVPPINQSQSTMIVNGYICTYSLTRHRGGPCSGTLSTIFLHCDLFYFKKEKQICSNYEVPQILNTYLSFTEKGFLDVLSTRNPSPTKAHAFGVAHSISRGSS